MSNDTSTVDQARRYYDSDDADNFYFRVWGGEDLHIGIYEREGESILEASRRTIRAMAAKLTGFGAGARIVDLGSGYGGSMRYLVREMGFHGTCLNLSPVQNERNRRMNREQGLDGQIEVFDGNFEALPFDDEFFDIAWSQDSILHSSDREAVFREVNRVLQPGGVFVMTDPMMREDASREDLQPVFDRIHLDSMGSVEKYRLYAKELGWEMDEPEERTNDLVTHYSSVLRELESRTDELLEHCSEAYLERMKKGLRHWISAGENGALFWGILVFRKPNP